MFGEPGGDFDLCKILKRDFDFAAFEFATDNLVNVRLGVVHTYGFARQSEGGVVFGRDHRNADVDIRQEVKIVVIHGAGDFAHVTRSAKFYSGRDGADGTVPNAPRQSVPGDFDLLSRGETTDVRFVAERAHQHAGEIALL